MDYAALLKRARDQLPESVFEKERFEIPKVVGHLEGSKTLIKNFGKIAQALERPVEHMLKFLLKELGTPGVFKRGVLTLGSKVSAGRINNKIRQYADQFVFCQECGKADSKMLKEGEYTVVKCLACGAKRNVKTL